MKPHQTDLLVAKALECGLFADMPHCSCTHYPEIASKGHGQTAFQFDDFGPHHAALRFIFRGNGDVLFSGCPNQWSDYQNSDIFRGYSDVAKQDLLAFTLDALPRIKATLSLYRETLPHNDYSNLMNVWSYVQPKLLDVRNEGNFASPWWRIW